MAISVSALAQPAGTIITEGVGCDPNFMTVVEAKAELEGQREVEAAERLLLKADSVLEYSCFINQVAGLVSGSVFQDDLFNAVDRLVVTPFSQYDSNNFNHTYGGGSLTSGGICQSMAAIWDLIKCQNFSTDYFVKLEDLAGDDIRTLPAPCNSAARNTQVANLLVLANPPVAVKMDTTDTFGNSIYPSAGCGSSLVIPTGIQLVTGGNDAVCSIPGCRYTGSTCQ